MTSNKRHWKSTWDVTKTLLGKESGESGWLCKWFCFSLLRELLFFNYCLKSYFRPFHSGMHSWVIRIWRSQKHLASQKYFFLRAFQTNAPNFLHATRGNCNFSMVLVCFVCVCHLWIDNHIFQTRYPNSGGND